MTRIEMPEAVEYILRELKKNGHEAYIVGGCVRDALLGRTPSDWDITTSALPQEVKKVFRRTVDTGIQHGTVTVLRGKTGYEVTTYRLDGNYGDGRHPDSVTFTPELREDLRRRDFTINAMAYSHETGVVDIFGGERDLEAGCIRCVGVPEERFGEDALRILRAVRFSAQLGFSIDPETEKALVMLAPNLRHVSRERIQTEITKTLLSPHPERILDTLRYRMAGYLSESFLGIFGRTGLSGDPADTPVGRNLRGAAGLPPEKYLRWAAFLAETEDLAEVILREMRLPNDTIRRAVCLVDNRRWDLEAAASDPYLVRRKMSEMDDELFDRLLMLRSVTDPAERGAISLIMIETAGIRQRGDCIRMKDLAVGGNDLMAAGMKPGKEMGGALSQLFDLVLRDPSMNEKSLLLAHIRK